MVFYKRYFFLYFLFPTTQITLYLKDNIINQYSILIRIRILKLKLGKVNEQE